MKDQLMITLFGEFTITYKDHTVTEQMNRSKKMWSLLGYLLMHRENGVSHSQLIDQLWGNSTSKDPSNSLKVLVHRVRGMLKELEQELGVQCILYYQDKYGWNPDIPCVLDIDLFEDACRSAWTSRQEDEKLKHLEKAVFLYKGNFMERSAAEPWIMQTNHYFVTRFLKACAEAAEILLKEKRYDELMDICRKALEYSPYDETFYIYLIKALAQTNQMQKAQEQYRKIAESLFEEFGVVPSEELTALYQDIIRKEKAPEMDLTIIQKQMADDNSMGAFFCENDAFKAIYHQRIRSAARSGESVYIVLISVLDREGKKVPAQRVLDHVMPALQYSIIHTLRRGDVVTKYSQNQLLILLPGTTFETSALVVQRMIKAYRTDFPYTAVVLHHSAQPVALPELQIKSK